MFMAPPVVFPLVDVVHPMPLTVLPVLLPQVDPVSTIFVVVPYMIVMMLSIVIPPLAMMVVVSSHYQRCNKGSAQD
jgi:hypothetical protein